jgi:hypothetical protein
MEKISNINEKQVLEVIAKQANSIDKLVNVIEYFSMKEKTMQVNCEKCGNVKISYDPIKNELGQ